MTAPRKTFIYFMRPIGMDGPVKIGCSIMPKKRLDDLSMWSPFPLELAAVARGDYQTEQALHERFAYLHSHREWFHSDPVLREAIAAISAGAAIDKAIDLGRKTGSIRKKRQQPVPEYRKGFRSYTARVRCAQNRLRFKEKRTAWHAPVDVEDIMRRWDGNSYRSVDGVRPTAAEFARLDEYLAAPEDHSIPPTWARTAA